LRVSHSKSKILHLKSKINYEHLSESSDAFFLQSIKNQLFANLSASIFIFKFSISWFPRPTSLHLRFKFRTMNYFKILFFAIIIAISACRNAEKPKNTEGSLLTATDASTTFAQQFPKAQDVSWDSLENGVAATFYDGKNDCKAYFDAKGVFQYATSFIEVGALPQPIQRFLTEKYKNANAAVVMSVKNAQSQTFQVELETATDYVNLEFDTAGKMLKEQKTPLTNDEMQRQEEEGVEKN
jgi:hypothetical protein